jgi:hypothetical protein
VNFTREPIIETVITPREGCKLVVRSSKGINQEDYFVDAVEVVSFGQSIFFRSQERPKSFLVPVSDYEILELKETRMVLKNVSSERSIKIGGGRENPVRSQPREPAEAENISETENAPPVQDRDKKQGDRRRSRRRRGGSMEMRHDAPLSEERPQQATSPTTEGVEKSAVEPAVAPSFISKLFPPPPTLIKETLHRYKTSEEGIIIDEKPSSPDEIEPPIPEPKPKSEDETKFED